MVNYPCIWDEFITLPTYLSKEMATYLPIQEEMVIHLPIWEESHLYPPIQDGVATYPLM